jgi:hypothetical protein
MLLRSVHVIVEKTENVGRKSAKKSPTGRHQMIHEQWRMRCGTGGGNETMVVATALAFETLRIAGNMAGTERAATTSLATRAFSVG